MSTEDRIKATAKNLEGKTEEAIGNITGDNSMQAEGKAKQVEAAGMNAVENIKEQAKNILDDIKDKIN